MATSELNAQQTVESRVQVQIEYRSAWSLGLGGLGLDHRLRAHALSQGKPIQSSTVGTLGRRLELLCHDSLRHCKCYSLGPLPRAATNQYLDSLDLNNETAIHIYKMTRLTIPRNKVTMLPENDTSVNQQKGNIQRQYSIRRMCKTACDLERVVVNVSEVRVEEGTLRCVKMQWRWRDHIGAVLQRSGL